MGPAPLSAGFHSLPLLPTVKLGPSGADSRVGGLVYILGPCGSLHQTLLWGWEFVLLLPQPPQVFSVSGWKLYFCSLELWVVWSVTGSTICCLSSQLQSSPPRSTIRHLAGSASGRLAASPCRDAPDAHLHPSYWCGWMFLLYLLGCRTSIEFDFSVSSGCFLFLNCCCPSFGCERRHSVSTYASIVSGNLDRVILDFHLSKSLLFITLNTFCQFLLACKVSFEKSADSLISCFVGNSLFFCCCL